MRTVADIYTKGFDPDQLDIPAPRVLVAPVKPPEKMGGIIATLATTTIEGTRAIMFRVVRDSGEWRTGDVVVLRNALLEPIQPDLGLLVVDAAHILGRVNLPPE